MLPIESEISHARLDEAHATSLMGSVTGNLPREVRRLLIKTLFRGIAATRFAHSRVEVTF
jgi:hypothetical protein